MNDDGENQETDPPKSGGSGGMPVYQLTDSVTGDIHYLRSDARLVARILSCGVVKPEQYAEILRGTFRLAIRELQKDEPSMRNLAAMHKVFEAGARLELDTVRNAQGRDQGGVNVNVGVGVQVGRLPVAEIVVNDRDEARQFAEIRQRLLEAAGDNGEKTKNGSS